MTHIVDTAIQIVLQTKEIFERPADSYRVIEKGRFNYVTQVDYEVQGYIREKLGALFPDIGFFSEEQDVETPDMSKPTWILDPVDGTTNLMHNYRQSAVSLGLLDGGEVVAGVIFNPFTDELFTARKGGGAALNGKPVRVSSAGSIGESLVAVGTTPYRKQDAPQNFELFQKVYMECQDIRRSGSAALDIAYVACGRTEAFFERGLSPWDYAAGIAVLNEAGGRISDWGDGSLQFTGKSNVLATNGRMHGYFLELLRE